MRVWRLAIGRYPALDGEGARLYGGRWNSPGTAMVYAATHLSLALLEQLVHVSPARLPEGFRAFAVDLADDTVIEHAQPDAGLGDIEATRGAGNRWATSLRSAALLVPSAVAPAATERNVLLNPRHPSAVAWRSVETSFRLDPRLRRAG